MLRKRLALHPVNDAATRSGCALAANGDARVGGQVFQLGHLVSETLSAGTLVVLMHPKAAKPGWPITLRLAAASGKAAAGNRIALSEPVK
jgi:hypothetical protein